MSISFIVTGVPAPGHARSKRSWMDRVRQAAQAALPPDWAMLPGTTSVEITYFFRGWDLDLDNLAKPILDALSGLVLADDRSVMELVLRKVDLALPVALFHVPVVLLSAIDEDTDFVVLTVREAKWWEQLA